MGIGVLELRSGLDCCLKGELIGGVVLLAAPSGNDEEEDDICVTRSGGLEWRGRRWSDTAGGDGGVSEMWMTMEVCDDSACRWSWCGRR